MDITLKGYKKSNSMANLLKLMCSLKCSFRITVDNFEVIDRSTDINSLLRNISILNVKCQDADRIIDVVDEVFDINEVEIIPDNDIMDDSGIHSEQDCLYNEEKVSVAGNAEEIVIAEKDKSEEVTSKVISGVSSKEDADNGDSLLDKVRVSQDKNRLLCEDYLLSRFRDKLSSIDNSEPWNAQAEEFLKCLDMPYDSLLQDMLIAARNAKKYTYGCILSHMQVRHENQFDEDVVKKLVIEMFNNWLSKYPDIKEIYPRISFMHVVKAFVKEVRK